MLKAGGFQQPAIEDYAIIGDCRTAALISREGSLDWLCLPDFSSASVFARLLDQRGGHFSIKPRSRFTTRRRYLPTTAVLETTFETDSGAARLTDLCPIVDSLSALEPMREILRVIEGIDGRVDLGIEFAPRPDYSRTKPAVGRIADGVWTCGWSNQLLLLNGSLGFIQDGEALHGVVSTARGKREYLSLSYTEGDIGTIAPLGSAADTRCERTIAWWRDWSKACQFEGPERGTVLRSAITLQVASSTGPKLECSQASVKRSASDGGSRTAPPMSAA